MRCPASGSYSIEPSKSSGRFATSSGPSRPNAARLRGSSIGSRDSASAMWKAVSYMRSRSRKPGRSSRGARAGTSAFSPFAYSGYAASSGVTALSSPVSARAWAASRAHSCSHSQPMSHGSAASSCSRPRARKPARSAAACVGVMEAGLRRRGSSVRRIASAAPSPPSAPSARRPRSCSRADGPETSTSQNVIGYVGLAFAWEVMRTYRASRGSNSMSRFAGERSFLRTTRENCSPSRLVASSCSVITNRSEYCRTSTRAMLCGSPRSTVQCCGKGTSFVWKYSGPSLPSVQMPGGPR